jgi:serine/threonine-protein kinase
MKAMSDHFKLDSWKSVQADSGQWFKAIETLGAGGNAATFLAYSTTPQKGVLYAIKVFRKLSKPERRESFKDELKFLRTCDHPAILRVFDEGVYNDKNPFIVMEYLPQTLRVAMRSHIFIAWKISYAMQLLSALDYLGGLNPPVVHRDIKPENIFIKGQSCVLGDFGLLKRLDDDDEQDKKILKESLGVGMPRYYRTPDLVAYLRGDEKLTSKSDVFQLGLVVAELFTGRNPAKSYRNFTDDVELNPLGNIPSAMGGLIASIIKDMLEVDPNNRPAPRQLLDRWETAFTRVVDLVHNIENRAF